MLQVSIRKNLAFRVSLGRVITAARVKLLLLLKREVIVHDLEQLLRLLWLLTVEGLLLGRNLDITARA